MEDITKRGRTQPSGPSRVLNRSPFIEWTRHGPSVVTHIQKHEGQIRYNYSVLLHQIVYVIWDLKRSVDFNIFNIFSSPDTFVIYIWEAMFRIDISRIMIDSLIGMIHIDSHVPVKYKRLSAYSGHRYFHNWPQKLEGRKKI